MTRKKANRTLQGIKAMMGEDGEFLRPMVRAVIQEFPEAEMAEAVGAEKGERRRRTLKLPQRLLCPQPDYAGREARIASAAGSQRTVFDRDFRALSAQREGARGGAHPRCASRESRPGKSLRLAKSSAGTVLAPVRSVRFNKKLDAELGRFALGGNWRANIPI